MGDARTAADSPDGAGPRSSPRYEARLREDSALALAESSRYFEGKSRLDDTLRALARRLDELGIDYAVAGGVALAVHGYPRMTEDIDLLVTRDGLRVIHERLDGRGYRREFPGSKSLRDTATGVKIEFLLTGGYPGSGEPQPLAFPDPASVERVEREHVKFLGLARLIELKLASGLTGGPDRAKDLVDVQSLIRSGSLPRELGDELHEYVRAKYLELWDALRGAPKRYVRFWRHEPPTIDAKSIDALIDALEGAASELRAMRADGVTLDATIGAPDGYCRLTTSDADVARKYDMHEESEFFLDEAGGLEPR